MQVPYTNPDAQPSPNGGRTKCYSINWTTLHKRKQTMVKCGNFWTSQTLAEETWGRLHEAGKNPTPITIKYYDFAF